MIKSNEVARGVRVVLNSEFVEKCIGDRFLKEEEFLFIEEASVYNDPNGAYVHIKGASRINSGYAYLNQLDLQYPIPS
jgi:hypothetical protein